jgi:hypothetical protein
MTSEGVLPEFTHADLVRAAVKWLLNHKGCLLAVSELSSMTSETPDAMGWQGNGASFLVECKASRADFRADFKKPYRDEQFAELHLGEERYYLVPAKLVSPEEVPDKWGLLWAYKGMVKVKKDPVRIPLGAGYTKERRMLISIAARTRRALQLVKNIEIPEGQEDAWKQ